MAGARRPGSTGTATGGGVAPGPLGAGANHPDLQSGLAKVDKMIAGGRRLGFTQAAINLENWRDGRGDRVMPASSFQSQEFLLKHLADKHRPKFIEGAEKRLREGVLGPNKPAEMDWTDSVNAPFNSDLWFALGGFTVHSHVKVEVVKNATGKHTLRFVLWKTDIADKYDWDAGKSTMIPGVGRVTDAEMLALERAGHGKSFRITSEVAAIVNAAVTGDASLRS